MAEESNDPPLNIETNEFDSVKICVENTASGSSTQSRGSIGDNARKNSVGKPDPPKNTRKTVPHYLRASTGSCHDLCKYGKRHASEEMPKKPLRIRRVKSTSSQLDSLETMASGEEVKNELKKEKVVKMAPKSHPPKLRASLDSKIDSLRQSKARLPNSTTKKPVAASNPPEIIKRVIVSTSRKAEVPARDGESVGNKVLRRDKKTNELSVKQSSPVIKAKTSLVSGNSDSKYGKGRRYSDVVSGSKMGAPILNAKKPLVPKTTSVKARRPKPLSHKTSKSEDSEKILHVVETGIETDVVPALVPSCEKDDEEIKYSVNEGDGFASDNILHVEMETNEEQTGKEKLGETLRIETEEIALEGIPDDLVIQDYPSVSFQKSLSLPNSPSLLSLVEEDEELSEEDESIADKAISLAIDNAETVEESLNKIPRKKRVLLSEDNKHSSPMKLKFRSGKTIDLQVVNNTPKRLKFRRARTFDNKADESFSNNSSKSIKADESVSTTNKTIEIGNSQDAKESQIKTSRKGKAIASEDKYRPPQSPRSTIKLSRSVKVVGPQTGSANSSRRLRFSQARVVTRAEDGKSDSSKRALRKIRSRDDLYGAGLSSRKVMLKHQDMQGKRDDQGLLFNNVIEETASKLVESRKSKVKALVGAFETVISLQERKPAMRTVG